MKAHEIQMTLVVHGSQYSKYESILADFQDRLSELDIPLQVDETTVEIKGKRTFKATYFSEDNKVAVAEYILENNQLRGNGTGFDNNEVIAPDMTEDEQSNYGYIVGKIIEDIESINGTVNVIFELTLNKMITIYS